ncbi:MAG: GerMN domain-containing protein [Lachnospiraceae bacterium]|nr:GerMN domain-containing protein [Lachnospiraceae bacterium]
MKKRKTGKIIAGMLSLLLLSGLFTGCGSKQTGEDGTYHAYYLNKEATRIIEEPYTPKAADTDTEGMIEEFLKVIAQTPEKVECRKLLRSNVEVTGYNLDGGQLSITFSEAYAQMEVSEEILCRAAIVRTMLQIPGISCVSFNVADLPLTDSKGNVIGLMTNESFVENPGEQINAIQSATIHLFFSNEAGDGLIETTEEVQYSSNISMEKLIMEHLLDGPTDKGMISAIPQGTGLVNVATTNGICYVNLDEGFMNQQYNIQEPIVIYSIVNSLSEIPTVNKVQISVNGDTKGMYRDSFALDDLYERNLDYVVGSDEDGTSSTETMVTESGE